MKNNITKAFAFLLCFMILSVSSVILISADEELLVWEMSSDETYITGNGNEYHNYVSAYNLHILTEKAYAYENPLEIPYEIYVYGSPTNKEVIWLDDGRIFVTKDGAEALDSFVSGEVYSYLLFNVSNDQTYSTLGGATVTDMVNRYGTRENAITVPVKELINVERYDICARDASQTFAFTVGAVYLYENEMYYVDYTALDNSYFDSNGNFSYRKGEVSMVPVGKENKLHLESAAASGYYFETEYIYENPSGFGLGVSNVLFWILLIILGYIFPAALLILGIIFANRKEWKRPKYWYALSAIALIWILSSAALTVLLLI